MNRRGFFATLAAAVAAPVALAKVGDVVRHPQVPSAQLASDPFYVNAVDLIDEAFRSLGLLLPGENARASDYQTAMYHLAELVVPPVVLSFLDLGETGRVTFRSWIDGRSVAPPVCGYQWARLFGPAGALRMLRLHLAADLSPMYCPRLLFL